MIRSLFAMISGHWQHALLGSASWVMLAAIVAVTFAVVLVVLFVAVRQAYKKK